MTLSWWYLLYSSPLENCAFVYFSIMMTEWTQKKKKLEQKFARSFWQWPWFFGRFIFFYFYKCMIQYFIINLTTKENVLFLKMYEIEKSTLNFYIFGRLNGKRFNDSLAIFDKSQECRQQFGRFIKFDWYLKSLSNFIISFLKLILQKKKYSKNVQPLSSFCQSSFKFVSYVILASKINSNSNKNILLCTPLFLQFPFYSIIERPETWAS